MKAQVSLGHRSDSLLIAAAWLRPAQFQHCAQSPQREDKTTCCTSRRYFTTNRWKYQVDKQSVSSKKSFSLNPFPNCTQIGATEGKMKCQKHVSLIRTLTFHLQVLYGRIRSGPQAWLPISDTWAASKRPMPGPPLDILSSWSRLWPGCHSPTLQHTD